MAKVEPTRIIDGVAYFNMTDGAAYMDMSGTGFRNKIRRLKVQQHKLPGSNEVLVKKEDLDNLSKPQVIEG